MPLYEYRCSNCQSRFELLRPYNQADEPAFCPTCRSSAQRVPSVFASFAKGSDGEVSAVGGRSACSGCSASSCATCR